MKTNLTPEIKQTKEGIEADRILRSCVHCGFCTATCPTYQLLGDELDSPRGRIYLIKELLEGKKVTRKTQKHLDRCLTCKSCETTCPSGVKYGRLIDIGRNFVEKKVQRSLQEKIKINLLNFVIPRPKIFATLFFLASILRPLLPNILKRKIPKVSKEKKGEAQLNLSLPRKMVLLKGCVQQTLAPDINVAAKRVLGFLGIQLEEIDGVDCCGAVTYHLNKQEQAVEKIKRNVDSWWPSLQSGYEAIVVTATGCGVTIKDYGHLLESNEKYAKRAFTISNSSQDISDIISAEKESLLQLLKTDPRNQDEEKELVAFHSPCTMQHGLNTGKDIEEILNAAGFETATVADGHLCCGSAGTYSLLQPKISSRLLKRKIKALENEKPTLIATANIGCLTHLKSGTELPVRHWIELIADKLNKPI